LPVMGLGSVALMMTHLEPAAIGIGMAGWVLRARA
jgi:hypothetical protein